MKKLEDPPRAPTTTIGPDAPAQNCSPSSIPQPPVSNTTRTTEGEYRTPSSPLTRARATAEAAKSWGIPLTSCPSSFAFRSSLDSSTINTYVAHCTLAPTLPSIATTAPSLPSISSISTSPSSNGRLSSHNYNLRSRSHIDNHPTQFSGLGLSQPGLVILTSRRRKSYLSKAIQRVGAKVASRRQFTLEGVLRALNTPGRVPP